MSGSKPRTDGLGNRALGAFRVRVERKKADHLTAEYTPVMGLSSSQEIRVEVMDQWGELYVDPVVISGHTSLGALTPISTTTNAGHAIFTLNSATDPGTAYVTFDSGNTTKTVAVAMGVNKLYAPIVAAK